MQAEPTSDQCEVRDEPGSSAATLRSLRRERGCVPRDGAHGPPLRVRGSRLVASPAPSSSPARPLQRGPPLSRLPARSARTGSSVPSREGSRPTAMASEHNFPSERDRVSGDSAAPRASLETDRSHCWLKISCIIFSCLGSCTAVAQRNGEKACLLP